MTTHTLPMAGTSQCALILDILSDHKGLWLPMPTLAGYSGSYNVHSRIADLRKQGHSIEHKNERHGRAVHSFYRIK